MKARDVHHTANSVSAALIWLAVSVPIIDSATRREWLAVLFWVVLADLMRRLARVGAPD